MENTLTVAELAAPSTWATGLTVRQAIRLDDLRSQVARGALALTAGEGQELAKLEWLIVQALHARALDENADRDRARIAELEAQLAKAVDLAVANANRVRELNAELAELEAERDQARADYAELRHAHAELEDQAGAMRRTIVRLRTDIRH